MTRKADINSTKYALFEAKTPEDEIIVKNLKKLSIQDDIPVNELLKQGIRLMFAQHHLDIGGNPQTTLETYHQTALRSMGKCDITNCKTKAVIKGLNLLTKKEQKFCSTHFQTLANRHDIKFWKWSNDFSK